MGFARFVGLRFLRPKRRSLFLSIISIIAITGVTVGVATLIVVLAVITGFQEDMTNKILGAYSHMLVLSHHSRIQDWPQVVETVQSVPGVLTASPFVYGEGMASTGNHAAGVIVRGIEPETASKVTSIGQSIDRGSLELLYSPQEVIGPQGDQVEKEMLPGVILGRELAASLRVFVGEKIQLINPMGEIGPLGVVPKARSFVVVGLFKSGLYEFDAKFAFIHLAQAQSFFGAGDSVSGLEVKIADIWQSEIVAQNIEETLKWPFYAKDWKQMNRNLFSAIKLEKLVMYIILCLIIFVASLNIFSGLYMAVMDKKKSIAMLRSMGASSRRIEQIILIQGMFIGVIGSIIGAALGVAICLVQIKYGLIKLDPRVYYIDTLPMTFKVLDFVVIFIASLGLSLVATLVPARIAGRLDVVKMLRYE